MYYLKSFVPPIEVQANARRALEVRAEKPPSQRGMVEEGLARARDLANGRALSIDTIRRMSSFFARHEVDKQGSTWSTYGKGWQAWMGWGGDAGRRWARRILALHDKPSAGQAKSTKSGTSFQKESPNAPANYGAQGGQVITGDLGRDQSGRFANAQNVQQGGVPQPAPTQPGAPPSSQPPLADLYAQYGNNLLENLGNGRYIDRRTGQEFTIEPKVPKDEQKVSNAQDTEKYLEASGLKAARSVLEQLSIGATEGITPDVRNRLFSSGLANVTPAGLQISVFGKRFLSIINANQDVAKKEMLIKETLYNAELYRKNQQIKQSDTPARRKNPYVPSYLQRVRKGLDMDIHKNETSFQEDAEGNGMAMSQLKALSDKAAQLVQMMESDNVGLEAWQQSKVTSAADDINAVYDAVKYSSSTEKVQKSQKTFGGIPREKLSNHDFVFSDERKFPIVTTRDVMDAISSWGRYKGKKSFNEFKERLMSIVSSKGNDFYNALPESWKEEAVIAKGMNTSSTFFKFATFMKGDPEQRIVVGYASSERMDGQNDIVESEALNQALGDYMQWANLREMHQPKAVGKVLQATPVRGTIQLKDGSKLVNPLRITAQIIDNETWEKVKNGVLKGFSIGGKVLQALTEKINGKEVRRITGLQLHEISLVDRPANPDARIVLLKRDDSPTDEHVVLQKAAQTDPTKILPQIQQLRNQAEMDGDLEQAERYNEVISLMLEAMGILPQGTMRATEEVESGEMPNENPVNNQPANSAPQFGQMPDDMSGMGGMGGMMSMDDVYAYNPSFQQTSNVAYSQMPDDLQKAGRTISAATASQLDQIMQAVQYIMQQVQQLRSQNQPATPPMPPMPDASGMMPPNMGGNPMDMQAVPSSEVPAPVESPMPQVQPNLQPQLPPTSMAPSPETMAMLRGIGNPVLAASQQTGNLRKEIDLASIEEEVKQMEQMTENSAPPAEAMEGTPVTEVASETEKPADSTEVVDKAMSSSQGDDTIAKSETTKVETVSIDVDAITKSLTGIIASQLEGINKQIERMETVAKEQHASLFETVNPLAEAINNTKAAVEPLVEKMTQLEPLVEKVDQLSQRIEALENTPVGNTPVLRGTAVNKALGGSAAADSQPTPADELTTLYKMIDETDNPFVRTKLREQAAHLEAKKIFK